MSRPGVALNARARALVVLAAALLAGCVGPATTAYHAEPGPLAVAVSRDVELPRPGGERPAPLRIAYPATGGPYPVVVFSHGGGSSRDMYDRLADHWASHGYVVVLPTHLDSKANGFTMAGVGEQQMLGIIGTRRADLVAVLDALPALPVRVPGLAGKVDAGHVVVAGHSLGGATAMTVAGIVLHDPKTGADLGFREPRFDALLLVTDPGHSPMAPADPWLAAPIPVFVVTGSKDYSGQWSGPPKERLLDFPPGFTPPAGVPRHYVFVEGMDHYIGGLICRTDKGPPDPEALRIVQGTSTAFLDAYAKGDARALRFLREGRLPAAAGPRPRLELR